MTRLGPALSLGLGLAASSLAMLTTGCPKSGEAERLARLSKVRQQVMAGERLKQEAQAKLKAALGHPWPPKRNQPFPDMEAFDLEGKPLKLSTFKGKVVLVHFVATTSDGSLGQAGGPESEPFQGLPPQKGVQRLDRALQAAGVPLDSSKFLWLQVMVYGPQAGVPTLADAKAWAKHYALADRPRTRLVYADQRYQVDETYALVPGYVVLDPEFKVVYERSNRPTSNTFPALVAGLKELLRARRPALPAYSRSISPHRARVEALGALLKQGKHEELNAEVAEVLAQGYREDEPGRTHLQAIEGLYSVEGVNEGHFAAWVAASPQSFIPAYLKGMAHVKWGWQARGHGWAKTVTEEGWAIFGRELEKARTSFTRANQISSSQPYGYTGLLIVARALGAPDKVREAYFSAAIQADPDYLAAYLTKLEAIYPKWGGSAEEAHDFVYGCVEGRPEYLPLQALIPSLHTEFARTVFEDGAAYLSQKPVARDCAAAIRNLRRAYPKSREVNRLALKLEKEQGVSVKASCELLAELKDPWGMGQYGSFLRRGTQGFKQDLTRAYELLLFAGRAGDSFACAEVAQALMWHPEFEHDFARAIPWLVQGSERSWCKEQLGFAYLRGRGVKVDVPKAADWFRRAGSKTGRTQLAEILNKHPSLRLPGDPK